MVRFPEIPSPMCFCGVIFPNVFEFKLELSLLLTEAVSLFFLFVTGWRGQRRGERQDRAGRSSRLLHGPHPREVARVSPSVADLPSLFFRRSVSSHSSWNSITYRHQSEWRSHHWIFNQYNSKTCLGKVAPLLLKWPWTEHPEVSVFAHQIVWLLEMCRFPRQMVLDWNSFFCVFGATTSP